MPEEKIKIADSSKRILAFIIDYSFVVLLMHSIYPLFLPFGWDTLTFEQQLKEIYPIYFLFLFILIFKDVVAGRSLGKRFAGLKIVKLDENTSSPPPGQLVSRNLYLILFPIEIYKLVFDPHCQRLGDKRNNMVVIEDQKNNSLRGLILKTSGLIFIACIFWFLTNFTMPYGIQRTTLFEQGKLALKYEPIILEKVGKDFEISFWSSLEYFEEGALLQVSLINEKLSIPVEVIFRKTSRGYEFDQTHILKE